VRRFRLGNVLLSIDVTHPLVRHEIVNALDLFQQSFGDNKSTHIVVRPFVRSLVRGRRESVGFR
jgi:hypothetical protein